MCAVIVDLLSGLPFGVLPDAACTVTTGSQRRLSQRLQVSPEAACCRAPIVYTVTIVSRQVWELHKPGYAPGDSAGEFESLRGSLMMWGPSGSSREGAMVGGDRAGSHGRELVRERAF